MLISRMVDVNENHEAYSSTVPHSQIRLRSPETTRSAREFGRDIPSSTRLTEGQNLLRFRPAIGHTAFAREYGLEVSTFVSLTHLSHLSSSITAMGWGARLKTLLSLGWSPEVISSTSLRMEIRASQKLGSACSER